ncbi:hypothetical protein HDU88_008721 [Geranomyces variabilis]|nr:hypothetical protein HDU88_008721 [Geranomyces variabilis]
MRYTTPTGNYSSTDPTSAIRAGKRPRTDNSTLKTEDRTYLANLDDSGEFDINRVCAELHTIVRTTQKKSAVCSASFMTPDKAQA